MSGLASDLTRLVIGTGAGAIAAELLRHTFTLTRPLTDRTSQSVWSQAASTQRPASAELRAEGLVLDAAVQSALRSQFLSGTEAPFTLLSPGEGQWSGGFFIRQLSFTGEAEGERRFALRLASTGEIMFLEEGA